MAETTFDNWVTTLAADCDSSVTSITLTDVPPDYTSGDEARLLVGSELMQVTAIDVSNVATVVRASEGTTAASHTTGDAVECILTKAGLAQMIDDRADARIALGGGGGGGVTNDFGDGSDGSVTISADTTWENDTSANDTGFVFKQFTDLTINSGKVVTAAHRSQVMIVKCTGNCTINGTLHMNAKGAAASVTLPTGLVASVIGGFATQLGGITATFQVPAIGASGGAGGSSGTLSNGSSGQSGAAGGTGGGGGGAGGSVAGAGGSGSAGTAYCGGSGGGGGGYDSGAGTGDPGTNAGVNGGAGGDGGTCSSNRAAAAGAGNPVGTGQAGSGGSVVAPTGGGGGTLILMVGGDLTIGGSAVISANGSSGGNAVGASGGHASGGGGAGGGSIIILYAGTLSNSGTIQALGGAAGTGTGSGSLNCNGGAGGDGSVQGPLQLAS